MKLKSLSLCALLLVSMMFVATEPATSEQEFPDNPIVPFVGPPDFGSHGVNPDTGWNDTTFSFWLNFSSEEEPNNLSAQVWVDNIPYDMFENRTKDTNYSDGKDFYWMNEQRLWSKGFRDFLFYVEINETSNMTSSESFEILNRAPYILSPPPMKIFVDEVVEYVIRVQDDDLDPIDGDLIDHNFTSQDWHWIEWYPDNLTWVGKPKQPFVRWLNITIWDSYDQLAWYRWTIVCVESEGSGDYEPPSPKGIEPPFPSGAGDPPITPTGEEPEPEPLANSFLDLKPNADGHELDWTAKGGSSHYLEVDDGNGTEDDDTTYISTTSGNQEDYWGLEDHTTETGIISNVRLSLRVKHSAGGEEFAFALANGSSEYVGSDVTDDTTWTTYTEDHAINPITSGPWYFGDIDLLQLGIKSRAIGGWKGTEYCTAGWITVTYAIAVPEPTTIFFWTGAGDGYQWDDNDNWVIYSAGSYIIAAAGVYPNANDDEAHINATADTIFLKDGANSVVTIGNLTLESGYTGALILSVDLIVDNANTKDGNITVNAGSLDTNSSANNQINLDGNLTISATFSEQAGIVIVQGAQVQKISITNSQVLYQLTLDTSGTVAELYDNLTVYKILIGAGTTYKLDSATRGYDLATSFSDLSGCGFVSTSSGTLEALGDGTNDPTFTTADASPPPTNYWNANMGTGDPDLTMDFTTLSYGNRLTSGGTWDVENTTLDNCASASWCAYIEAIATITAFNNNTLSNGGNGLGIRKAHTDFNNIVVSSMSTLDIGSYDADVEFTNSNFDETSVHITTGNIISSVHNDVANAYKIISTTLSKSSITNKHTSGDNIQLISGTYTIDEASASDDFTVDSGATLVLNTAQTHTFDANANLTNNGILKSDGTITSGGYFDFYNTGNIWLNNSTVSSADLNYYYGGFNFSVGKDANSTIDDWTLEAPSGQDTAFNVTYYDFNNRNRNPNEQWLVNGTQEFGTFPACIATKSDSAYCSYWEEDDDLGALTGDSVLLTPTGVGKYTQWDGTYPGGRPHWQMVDDDPPHDDNTTAIWTVTDGVVDSYAMEDISIVPPGTKVAGSMTLFAWASDDGPVWNGQVANFVRTVSTDYNSSYYDLPDWTAWRNLTTNHATNPNTGVEWTLAQINAMEVGVTAGPNLAAAPLWVSSVGAVVPTQYVNYVLNLQYNFTTLPTGADYYNLTVTGSRSVDTENVNIQLWDYTASGWNTRATINSDSDADYTYTLTSDEISTSAARVRFVDAAGDTTQTNLSLDWVNIHATYLDYSQAIWHMNVTASSGSVKFCTGNLTSGETYRSYVDSVQHTEGDADSGDYYNFSYAGWSTRHIYLIWGASGPVPDVPGPGQYDRWIVGFEYSKHPFTNEVKFTAVFNYDHNASWYIWDFDGAIYESASPNVTRNFQFAFYSTENVKLTIIATDGNRYWAESPIVLDNSLWIALLCLGLITFGAVVILNTRKERMKSELVMVEYD